MEGWKVLGAIFIGGIAGCVAGAAILLAGLLGRRSTRPRVHVTNGYPVEPTDVAGDPPQRGSGAVRPILDARTSPFAAPALEDFARNWDAGAAWRESKRYERLNPPVNWPSPDKSLASFAEAWHELAVLGVPVVVADGGKERAATLAERIRSYAKHAKRKARWHANFQKRVALLCDACGAPPEGSLFERVEFLAKAYGSRRLDDSELEIVIGAIERALRSGGVPEGVGLVDRVKLAAEAYRNAASVVACVPGPVTDPYRGVLRPNADGTVDFDSVTPAMRESLVRDVRDAIANAISRELVDGGAARMKAAPFKSATDWMNGEWNRTEPVNEAYEVTGRRAPTVVGPLKTFVPITCLCPACNARLTVSATARGMRSPLTFRVVCPECQRGLWFKAESFRVGDVQRGGNDEAKDNVTKDATDGKAKEEAYGVGSETIE